VALRRGAWPMAVCDAAMRHGGIGGKIHNGRVRVDDSSLPRRASGRGAAGIRFSRKGERTVQTWEYHVAQFIFYEAEDTLNELGDAGWELAGIMKDKLHDGGSRGLDYIAFLKRPMKPVVHIHHLADK